MGTKDRSWASELASTAGKWLCRVGGVGSVLLVSAACGSTASPTTDQRSNPGVASVREAMSLRPGAVEFQPDVLWGGRTQAVSVRPDDASSIIAATDNGGLFRTTNGGTANNSWAHLDGLLPTQMMDVGISANDTDVVIATALRDSRLTLGPGGNAGNGGGIWVSDDFGDTWAPANFPDPNTTPPSPYAAYGIAFQAGTSNIYVGTDFGLAVSTDDGATWDHVQIAPMLNQWVVSVAVQGGIIDLLDQGGHSRATTAGLLAAIANGTTGTFNWTRNALPGTNSADITLGGIATSSIARMPQDNNVLFVAVRSGSDFDVLESDDAGQTWTSLNGNPRGQNRTTFVVSSPGYTDGSNNQFFDIWTTDGVDLFTMQCTPTAGNCSTNIANCDCTPGGWQGTGLASSRPTPPALPWPRQQGINLRSGSRGQFPSGGNVTDCANSGGPCAHNDPSDIVFDPTGNTNCLSDGRPIPMLLAADGGLMKLGDNQSNTDTCGVVWDTFGAGPGGFAALEMWEVTGQVHGPGVDTWLYFGTQDNHVWASDDVDLTGRLWTGNIPFEGFSIDLPHFAETPSPAMLVTATVCASCRNRYANSDFSSVSLWMDAPGPAARRCLDADTDGNCDCVDANSDMTCEPNNALCTSVGGLITCQPGCIDNDNDGVCDGSNICPDTDGDLMCDNLIPACLDVNPADGVCDCVDGNNDGVCETNSALCGIVAGQVVCQAGCINNDNDGVCDGLNCVDSEPDFFCDSAGPTVPTSTFAPRAISDSLHVQFARQSITNSSTLATEFQLYQSTNAGVSWRAVPGARVTATSNDANLVGQTTTPMLYVGSTGGLIQLDLSVSPAVPTTLPRPIGSPTILTYVQNPGFQTLQALGFHPTQSETILAAFSDNQVRMTLNAGDDGWGANAAGMAQLTTLVQGDGAYAFRQTVAGAATAYSASQVMGVGFDANSNTILVGTLDAGIISSVDGGANWARVCGTELIPNVTSFFFDEGCTDADCEPDDVREPSVYASSFGRGMWQVDPAEQQIPEFDAEPMDVTVNDCGLVDIGDANAVDTCENLDVDVVAAVDAVFGDPDFGCDINRPCGDFPRGNTVVTWTATDSAGDTSTTTSIVTVDDTTPPIFDADELPPVSLSVCAGDGEEVKLDVPTARDACIGDADVTGEVIESDSLAVPVPVADDGAVVLPIGTHVVRWTASDGMTSTTLDQTVIVSPGVYANGELQVRDRGQVLLIDEDPFNPAAIANAGNIITRVGDEAVSGAILSNADVDVDGGTVRGTATSPGSITTPNGGNITDGPVAATPALPPFPTLEDVTFPAPGADVPVNSGTVPLAPGSYGIVSLNSGSPIPPTLQLSAGDYYFQQLTSNTDSVIELDGSGPVRIFVAVHMDYRGPFLHSDGSLAEVFIGYTGTDQLTLEAPFLGTVVAPNARLEMGTGDALEFRGRFYAQTLWVRPDVRLICLGSNDLEGDLPGDGCFDGAQNGDETDEDCGGSCPACPDGASCSDGDDCFSGVCSSGVCQVAACNDGVTNGDEEGVDCGGSCPPCSTTCNVATYQAETMFHSTGGSTPGGWNIWANGFISTDHDFIAGDARVVVMAQGQEAGGALPHMVVTVDGNPIGDVNVATGSFQEYEFFFTASGGTQEIQVVFDNDFYDPPADRNLLVDEVTVDCEPAPSGGALSAEFVVQADWGSGYCVDLVVNNVGIAPVSGWNVVVNTNQSTTFETWNGFFSGNSGAVTVEPNFAWDPTATIAPGGTTSAIGFCANRNGGPGLLPFVVSVAP